MAFETAKLDFFVSVFQHEVRCFDSLTSITDWSLGKRFKSSLYDFLFSAS
jgi:hypothetical protein